MQDATEVTQQAPRRYPWNKGKLTGAKPPLRPKHVWSSRSKLQLEGRLRDLAMFNLAIDSKLRGCDVISLKVEDAAPHGHAVDRAAVRQKKTGPPVRFELTEQARESTDAYLGATAKRPGEFLFTGRGSCVRCLTARQYARLVSQWIGASGLDPSFFGTHSLRRTKATLIYRRTGNLRAVQLPLGDTKIESTVRYLGIEVDDAHAIAEQVDVCSMGQSRPALPLPQRSERANSDRIPAATPPRPSRRDNITGVRGEAHPLFVFACLDRVKLRPIGSDYASRHQSMT